MFHHRTFLVKERVGFFKLADTFDIYDPASGMQIGIANERISPLLKIARLVINKRLLPTLVEIRERTDGPVVLSLRRGSALLHANVTVRDAAGGELGRFKSKLFSLGGGFDVFDAQQRPVAEIKGDWKGWNFRFLTSDGSELGKVTKKWGGLGKELLTSADNYIISLTDHARLTQESVMLLLAAGLAIDVVYKEK